MVSNITWIPTTTCQPVTTTDNWYEYLSHPYNLALESEKESSNELKINIKKSQIKFNFNL